VNTFSFKMPDLGEGTVEAEIIAWHVKPGDTVTEDQVLADVMTEKATVELPAPVAGRIVSLVGSPGESVTVGTEIIVFETAATAATPATATSTASVEPRPQSEAASHKGANDRERVLTSPSIRRLARETGIDLTGIHGTGPMGRILREDLAPHLSDQNRAWEQEATPATVNDDGAKTSAGTAGIKEIEVIGVRRLIAKRMTEANREVPHFGYVEEVDMTDLERVRQHLNNKYARERGSLTYLPFITLGLIRALRDHPQCNSHYDKERRVLLQHAAVNIGLATHTDDGLKVPVIRNAERCSLWQLAEQLRAVAEAARNGTATPEQLTGSTITITSLGKLGGVVSTPIVNTPEVAIISVNRAVERPAVVNGKLTVRRMMNISSSFDHRFIDGYVAAALIQNLKKLLENPTALFSDK
jgi:2-oxoisovalerate dehydrogenase E2 component (dihydrolipoyl transacylase)